MSCWAVRVLRSTVWRGGVLAWALRWECGEVGGGGEEWHGGTGGGSVRGVRTALFALLGCHVGLSDLFGVRVRSGKDGSGVLFWKML